MHHSHDPKFLKVEPYDSVHKHLGILFSVPFRNVHNIRLHNNGVNLTVSVKLVNGGNGTVVLEPVFAADDSKAEDVFVIVENLEPLGAG